MGGCELHASTTAMATLTRSCTIVEGHASFFPRKECCRSLCEFPPQRPSASMGTLNPLQDPAPSTFTLGGQSCLCETARTQHIGGRVPPPPPSVLATIAHFCRS